MSQGSDDAPTGPIRGQTAPVTADPPRRRILVRDMTAGVLLVVALLLPWNLYFGVGIPGSRTALFAVLGLVTLLSLVSLALTRLRAPLNVPYQLLVIAFVVFDVVQTVRSGGGVHVPGGVGPGAWLGIAGSLLAAQPAVGAADERYRSARIVGYASIVVALWAARLPPVLAGALCVAGRSGFGKQNIAVIATALVYGAMALAAVLVASGWLLRSSKASRLATVRSGPRHWSPGSWCGHFPVGRDIDAFHGIAQNTSTAGVGFEGYLAWAAGAAIFAPSALRAPHAERLKECLAGSGPKSLAAHRRMVPGIGAMRITDLVVAVS